MHFNGTKFYTLLLCCLASPFANFAQTAKESNTPGMDGKKPMVFLENKGQITNQHLKTRNDVQYKLSGKGMDVFVGNGQLHYQFNKTSILNATAKAKHKALKSTTQTYRMDVALIGANKNAVAISEDKQEYRESYHLARMGEQQVTAYSYKKVTYKNVYPNIDWVLYVKDHSLEYDFVVRPGGDVKNIQLSYTGATKLAMKEGNVTLTTPMGDITEKKPFTYDAANGSLVASNFNLNKNTLSFNVAAHEGTIVIDPQIEWATYYGGTSYDQSYGSALDNNGNIYLTGVTNSAANIATIGSHSAVLGGGFGDAFIAKFSPAGGLLWASYIGGSGYDAGQGVACDPSGNVYITGTTTSTAGVATTGAFQSTYGGGGFGQGDGFLSKFNSGDTMLWSTYYGGMSNDAAYAVACNASGDVYFGGNTNSTALRVMYSPNGNDTSFNGTSDVFLAKFRSNGTRAWSTFFGGGALDQLQGLAVDRYGNIYGTGETYSTSGVATTGAFQTSVSGTTPQTGFLFKFDSTSHLKWATYYGANSTIGYGVICDTFGSLYFSGYTSSTTNISSTNSYQSALAGSTDIFLAKFDTSGGRVWGTYYGGVLAEQNVGGLAFDNWGNIIMTGHTASTSGIATSINGSVQPTFGGSKDACLVKFTPLGQLIWGTYFGNTGDDEGTGVQYSTASGAMYLSGWTNSTNGISQGVSPYQSTFGGGATGGFLVGDAFLAKFNPDTMVLVKQKYTDTLLCPGGTWNVAYTTSYDFNTGNTFTVQLSNATGSFATPVNIGTVTATSSGTISATLPNITALGTGYRVRVVSSSPAFTSPDDYYNITVVGGIAAPVANSNTPLCVGDTLRLTSSNTANPPVTQYSWTGPGGFTSTSQNPNRPGVTTTMAGTYTVTTTRSGCPGTSANTTVAINSVFPAFPSDSSNSSICAGSTLYLFGKTSTLGATYSWRGPNGFTSTLQNPSIPAATSLATGEYYVSAILNTCKSTDSLYAEVDAPGTVTLTISGVPTDTFCVGDDANFISTTTLGGNAPQYQWVVNHITEVGAISNVWGSPYLGNGDTIFCILTSNASCIANPIDTSNYIVVTILPIVPPTVTISASPSRVTTPGQTIIFTATVTNGGSAPTYQWYKNGIMIPGATTNPYATNNISNGDVMSCVVVSNAQCVAPNTASGSSARLGVDDVMGAITGSLYPNPNNGNFTVNAVFNGAAPNEATIEVVNIAGQTIYHDVASFSNNSLKKNVSLATDLPNGIYMLRIQAGDAINVMHFSVNK